MSVIMHCIKHYTVGPSDLKSISFIALTYGSVHVRFSFALYFISILLHSELIVNSLHISAFNLPASSSVV